VCAVVARLRCARCGYTAPNARNDNAQTPNSMPFNLPLLALQSRLRPTCRGSISEVSAPRSSPLVILQIAQFLRIPIPTHQAPNPRSPSRTRQIVHAVGNDQTILAIAASIVGFAVVITTTYVSPLPFRTPTICFQTCGLRCGVNVLKKLTVPVIVSP
jgi:hypothetical protein